jgi:hypothetical protein
VIIVGFYKHWRKWEEGGIPEGLRKDATLLEPCKIAFNLNYEYLHKYLL